MPKISGLYDFYIPHNGTPVSAAPVTIGSSAERLHADERVTNKAIRKMICSLYGRQ